MGGGSYPSAEMQLVYSTGRVKFGFLERAYRKVPKSYYIKSNMLSQRLAVDIGSSGSM